MSPPHVCYIRLTKNGVKEEDHRHILERRGIDLSSEFAPLYVDQPFRSGKRMQVMLENLPQLSAALKTLRPNEVLTVPDLGTFGTHLLWTEVCEKVVYKGAIILDAKSGQTFNPSDMKDFISGQRLVLELARKAQTATASRARASGSVKTGPKSKLTDKHVKKIADEWWSNSDINSINDVNALVKSELGVDVSKLTLIRNMKKHFGVDRTTILNRQRIKEQ